MDDLDFYSLSRILGARMVPIKAPIFGHFGHFGLVEMTAETVGILHTPPKDRPHFSVHQEKALVQAFEKVRDGLPPEALLWDSAMVERFMETCRKSGLDLPQDELVRRLQMVRKNPKHYAKFGIRLKPTARREHSSTALAAYAPLIEFSLVRLRYRFGSSIDEILIDPALGQELEKTVRACIPSLSSQQIRKAALTLRKRRFLPRNRAPSVRRLRTDRLENIWSPICSLGSLDLAAVPSCGGIVQLRQGDKELYISRNENVHDMLETLLDRNALSIMAGPFWSLNTGDVETRFISADSCGSAKLERWELKLLAERKPVFNWPVASTKRAA